MAERERDFFSAQIGWAGILPLEKKLNLMGIKCIFNGVVKKKLQGLEGHIAVYIHRNHLWKEFEIETVERN